MTLLDCAFSFFANFPCRLSMSEMKFDLPSEEAFFATLHPFSQRNFTPCRNLTTMEAFQSLFKPSQVSGHGTKGNPLGLNPMDMFILIHRMFPICLPSAAHFLWHLSTCLFWELLLVLLVRLSYWLKDFCRLQTLHFLKFYE